ncbi:DUF4198 domain-containing protein [Buttiauxella sp. B2]|uniref:DUF4198 domain-containing protein n=1 Tax=Buttiauxella sp. B2 TaxID=2587812 RepID=UPI001124A07C|nr:DUF4198 domain-containing protein [Buttiauxella sp. B2]TNV10188.1 DUF4198 domain-containing protein [Buttiauxella sp. B2]
MHSQINNILWLVKRAILICVAMLSTSVSAHDFWILPHDPTGAVGDKVIFELRIGPGWPGTRTARIPGLISTFNAWDIQGKRLVEGHEGALVIGHLKNRVPGTTTVGLTTNGAQITLAADEFEDYLKEEGLNKVILKRRENQESGQPGVEIFSRFAKTLIQVGDKSEGYDRVVGLERELVLLTDPLKYQPGEPLELKLLAHGNPLQGIQVKAELNTSPPTIIKAITNVEGKASFALQEKGEWLFSAVDMEPSSDPDADWHSLWASLTVMLKGK